MAALSELREHVRAGDISISGSRQYMDFEDYLIPQERWNEEKNIAKLSVSPIFERICDGKNG